MRVMRIQLLFILTCPFALEAHVLKNCADENVSRNCLNDWNSIEYGMFLSFRDILVDVMSHLERCSLIFIVDQFHSTLFDSHIWLKTSQEDQKSKNFHWIPRMIYLLPQNSDDDSFGTELSALEAQLRRIKEESCLHYSFMMKNYTTVKKIIDVMSKSLLDLDAKFILFIDGITTKEKTQKINSGMILKTRPLNKIVNLLLVVPQILETEPMNPKFGPIQITFFTHFFFTKNMKRFQVETLGRWQQKRLVKNSQIKTNYLNTKQQIWFPPKLQNFQNFMMKASTFHYPPVTIFNHKTDSSQAIDGLEVRLLKTLAFALKFDFKIETPKDGEKWGRDLLNGSWTGAFGEVLRGDVDIAFANFFITLERLHLVDMTQPYHIDYTCFITPIPKPLPRYAIVFLPFQKTVWIVIAVCLTLLPPTLMMLSVMEDNQWFSRLSNSSLYVWGLFLNRANGVKLKSSNLRILLVFVSLAFLALGVVYITSLFSLLLLPSVGKPVNSLSELLESGLDWGVRDSGGWEKWFSDSIDPTSQQIAAGFHFVKGIDGGISRVVRGNFAFMNSGTYLRYLVASNFTDEFGQAQLHITKECFVPFRIGLVLPKFSIYTSKFNSVIAKVVEAGLVNQWFKNLVENASNIYKKIAASSTSTNKSTKLKVLGIYDLQGVFILLGLGWICAAITLLVELSRWRQVSLVRN